MYSSQFLVRGFVALVCAGSLAHSDHLAAHAGPLYSSGPQVAAPVTASGRTPNTPATAGASSGGLSSLTAAGVAQSAMSRNWSGYVVTSGSYTAVTGTFTVPSVSRHVAGPTVSEWVGIDGWTNKSLIQAGVNEIPENGGEFLVEPWWQVLPAPQRLAPGVMVHVGDTVTVAIHQVMGSEWAITLADNTNGDSFTTDQTYNGPSSSAEWVVEANSEENGAPTALAPYKPQVSFTDLGLTGPQASITRLVMAQSGQNVSSPSAIVGAGFTVAYSGAAL
jgi:hypothetical protein